MTFSFLFSSLSTILPFLSFVFSLLSLYSIFLSNTRSKTGINRAKMSLMFWYNTGK
eukprot:UN33709